MSAPLVLPLGRQLSVSRGRHTPDGEPDRDDVQARVQLGLGTVVLGGPAFTLWSACHGHPELSDDRPWTTDDARSLCRTWGMGAADTDRAWDELVDSGTVSTLTLTVATTADDADTGARREWARGHRLVPQVIGLGNTVEEPEVFAVGLPEQPLLTMTSPLYEVWSLGTVFPDLGSAVWWYADQAAATGRTEAGVTDPDHLLATVVAGLHRFLTVRAAHLDVVGSV